jgi:predicted RNA binding protein YcfA (HicA-like mRNA interferase family)
MQHRSWNRNNEGQGIDENSGEGWLESNQNARKPPQYRHPEKAGTVTVAGKTSADIPPGTLASILKQAGLK